MGRFPVLLLEDADHDIIELTKGTKNHPKKYQWGKVITRQQKEKLQHSQNP